MPRRTYRVAVFLVLVISAIACEETAAPAKAPRESKGFHFVLSEDEVRAAAQADVETLTEVVRTLSAIPSRVPGYGGTSEAARHVLHWFEAAGLTEIQELPFTVTSPIEKKAVLIGPQDDPVLTASTFLLHGCWPNLVRTVRTPPGGITGTLVYGGLGTLEDLKGKPIEGSLVVLEYNSGRNWLNVPALGGRAVLFVAPETTTHLESAAKFLRTPVDVPRFYLSRAAWQRLRTQVGKSFTVEAQVTWEDVTEVNLIGWVRGTGTKPNAFGRTLADEVVILSAYYDAMSVVPALAPGSEQACGIAALVDFARYFSAHPPPRTLLFLATSAHGFFMEGVTQFFDRHTSELDVKPATFIALDLASCGNTVGAFNYGHAYWDGWLATRLPDLFAPLGAQLNLLAHRTALAIGLYTQEEYERKGFDRNPVLSPFVESLTGTSLSKAGTQWGHTLPTGMVHEAETAMLFGHLAYAFVTWGRERPLVDSPLDTFERFQVENLTAQVRFLKPMLKEMLHSEDPVSGMITRIDQIVDWQRQGHRAKFFPPIGTNAGIVSGRVVEFIPKRSYIPDEPKPNALVVVRQESANTYLGVRCEPIQRVRTVVRNGQEVQACFRFPNIGRGPLDAFTSRARQIEAYVLDEASGAVVYAKDLGRNGETLYPTEVFRNTTPQEVRRTVVVFPCYAVDLFDLFDPRYLTILGGMHLLDAQSDTEPESFGMALTPPSGGAPNEPGARAYYDPCAALFIQRREGWSRTFKALGSAGIFGRRLTLLNATPEQPTGAGIDAADGPIYHTALRAANDMCLLNAYRVRQLADTGILRVSETGTELGAPTNSLLASLQVQSKQQLNTARRALESRGYPAYMHASRSAWALASRAYPLVLRIGKDAVWSVLFYLALLLPSAFFLERLLFGFPDIKRQLIGRAAIFGTVFLLLRAVNPAFALTVNPFVVLLGFVMVALTAAVLRVIMKMLQTELKRMRAEATGIHNVEIGRSDAAGVAFGLGISSMRKRKLRTANTLVTLILLTFSVLSFTSVVSRSELKGRELFDVSLNRVRAPYEGVLFRSPVYDPILPSAYEHLLTEFRQAKTISPRAWYPGGTAPQNALTRVDTEDKSVTVPSILGLTPEEREIALANPAWLTGEWFQPGEGAAALLSASLARLLGLNDDAIGKKRLTIRGMAFVLKGILADDFFIRDKGFLDIDGEPITPVNYAMSASTYQEAVSTRPDIIARKPPPTFTHYGPLDVVILPYQTVLDMGGNIRSIAVAAQEPQQISERVLRDEILNKLAAGLFAGIGGRSYWYTSLGQADYRGLFSLTILILIAGLIVFNTILGSLFERQREIGIYTSLGLAPSHIGAFFFAESCVYAVLACLFGYLLGQVVGSVKTSFAIEALEALTLNYSSRSALYAALIVSAVVMLSSAYPAWKASRLSVPELERTVHLPAPVDDAMVLEFPFTFSREAQAGIGAFLYRHFKDQEELTTGPFHAQGVRMWEEPKQGLEESSGVRLAATVWLAPYDWGISQTVAIWFAESPSGIVAPERTPVLVLRLRRLDGEMKAWQRVNRVFVAQLRRQLLLWRTITPEDRLRYVTYGHRLLRGDRDADVKGYGQHQADEASPA